MTSLVLLARLHQIKHRFWMHRYPDSGHPGREGLTSSHPRLKVNEVDMACRLRLG